MAGVLNQLPEKPDFIEDLNSSLKESNSYNIQECYLIGDFDVNLLRGNKIVLKQKHSDSYSEGPPLP